MSILEVMIRRLLSNSKIEYFEKNIKFRNHVLDRPEATKILVNIVLEDDLEISTRAGEMLSLFSWEGVSSILEEVYFVDTESRTIFLSILWSIAANSLDFNRSDMFQESVQYILPLLDDCSTSTIIETQHPVEIEYEEYRICDEAYLLLCFIQDRHFETEDVFKDLTYEERDSVIKAFRSRHLPMA